MSLGNFAIRGAVLLKHKIYSSFCLLLLLMLFCTGCAGTKSAADSGEKPYMSITDDNGRQVTLLKKPQRIVALSASFLEPLQAVDASIVGRPSSKTGIPEAARQIDEVGAVYQINIEKVVALQPDLVIAYKGMHDKFVASLESNNIPVIVVEMKTYEDVKEKVKLFAQITGETEKGQSLINQMDQKIEAVQSKLPKDSKRVAILHSTAQDVTVQLDGSIAGSVAKMLGFSNVAADSQPLDKNPDASPYSLETLVKQNPDIVFVTSMGDMDTLRQSFMDNVAKNPAWQALPAAKEKRIYFLPQQLFLLNPGIHYPEAVETMAEIVYPGVFNHDK